MNDGSHDPSFVPKAIHQGIVFRITPRIDCKSNLGAWRSQGIALVWQHRSRTIRPRGHRPPPNLDSYLITAWDERWPRCLAGGFCFAKFRPSVLLARCHIAPTDVGMPKADGALRYRYEIKWLPPATRLIASLRFSHDWASLRINDLAASIALRSLSIRRPKVTPLLDLGKHDRTWLVTTPT